MLDAIRLQESAERASTLLKAMANKRRLLILCQLAEGEKSVGDLETLINLNQSALSQHLAILRRNNLVQTRRVAQTIFYSLASAEASGIMQTLYELYCGGAADKAAAARSDSGRGSETDGRRRRAVPR